MSTDESNVPVAVLAKCNVMLQHALHRLLGTEELTILATLKIASAKPPMPSPKEYRSRMEWRKSCIQLMNEFYERETAEVISSLKSLQLNVNPQEPSSVKVIRGTKANIVKALCLQGIEHASLDQEMELNLPIGQ